MRPSALVATLLGGGMLLAAAVLLRQRPIPSHAPPPAPSARVIDDEPAVPEQPRDAGESPAPLPTSANPGTALGTRLKAQEALGERFADKLQLVDETRERFIDDYVDYARPILETDRAAVGAEAYRQLLDVQWLQLESRLRGYLTEEQIVVTRRRLGRK